MLSRSVLSREGVGGWRLGKTSESRQIITDFIEFGRGRRSRGDGVGFKSESNRERF